MNSGLYLHIPFCKHKCGYCDFYSSTNADQYESAFVEALLKDISLNKSEIKSKVDTIFLGGGTPSMIGSKDLDRILSQLYKTFEIDKNAEVTIETNPGTVDKGKLADFKSMGINRISFGVQSFHEDELKLMERIHDADTAIRNIEEARNVGFNNISMDLIFALPGQSLNAWKENLEQAVQLDIDHISAYNLIFEKNTAFKMRLKAGEFEQQSEENERQFYEYTIDFLRKHGFHQYEISNYAKSDNFKSKHNVKYWSHDPYVGFGPSAHSFDGKNKRYWRIRSTEKYIQYIDEKKSPIIGSESLEKKDLIFEYIMLGLRMIEGVNIDKFNKDFKLNFIDRYKTQIEKFRLMNLLEIKNNYCRLTKEGVFYCDEIITHFS